MADHVGLRLHVVEIGAKDVIDCLPHLVAQYGQPFGDASAVPSFLLARFAREEVKVCLSGDGGDESFGGYWRMQAGVYAARYGRLVPEGIRRHVVPRIAANLGGVGRRWDAMNRLSLWQPRGGLHQLRELARLPAGPGGSPRPCEGCPMIGTPVAMEKCNRQEGSVFQRILAADFQVQLPDAYLTKVDVASMAASLEVRAPFLDRDVVEQAWVLPDRTKLHWGGRKWMLKRLAARRGTAGGRLSTKDGLRAATRALVARRSG